MDSDIELSHMPSAHLINDVVSTFSWSDVSVVVKDRATKKPLSILSKPAGLVHAGEMLAIMGPSGSGKTTLLNTLARRVAAAGATTSGDIRVNGVVVDTKTLRDISAYVEQEDALIGSLTVRETMIFAAQLALPKYVLDVIPCQGDGRPANRTPRNVTRKEAFKRVDDLIASFGLASQASTIVGTPIKKGLSGGQKKRLGVASRLVTNPRVLFLDEPTSGLDSALSYEVMKYIKDIGKQNNVRVPPRSNFNIRLTTRSSSSLHRSINPRQPPTSSSTSSTFSPKAEPATSAPSTTPLLTSKGSDTPSPP
jgi:ABC-type lipoprotein export system ATPase subunit